jgi:hypothetical protein
MIPMPFIERLLKQKPKRRVSERFDHQYKMFVGYMPEIEEAQKLGYSWHQICGAVQNEMTEKGEWDESWGFWDVQKFYYAAKRKRAA